jgi:hypothetical protein
VDVGELTRGGGIYVRAMGSNTAVVGGGGSKAERAELTQDSPVTVYLLPIVLVTFTVVTL